MTFGLSQLSVLPATALATAEKTREKVECHLDRQAETLRMVWKQYRGRPGASFPVDD